MDSTAKPSRSSQPESVTAASRHPISGFSYFAAILFLIFCTQPALTTIRSYDLDTKSDFVAFLFQFVAYSVVFISIGSSWRMLLKETFSRRMLWILLITAVAFLSAVWSDVPGMTIRRAMLLLLTELIAVYFATSFTPRQQFQIVSTTLLILLVLSLVAVVTNPAYGTMPGTIDAKLAGNWRGVFPHKNTLGRYASLAAVIFVLNWLGEHRKRWAFAILISLAMLAGSKSVTSIAVTAAVLLSLPLFRLLRGRWFYSAVAFIGAVFAAAIWYVFNNFYAVVDMTGRDVTLSGRLPLWFAGIMVGLRRNPWLGYGWAGFWRGYDGDSAAVWRFVHWQAPNIHNGYLDLWLSLGLLGLLCFGACHLITMIRAVRLQRLSRSSEALWPLAFLLYFTLQNMTESIGVSQNSLVWILYVMVVYQVYEAVARRHTLAFSKSLPGVAPICERTAMRPVGAMTVMR